MCTNLWSFNTLMFQWISLADFGSDWCIQLAISDVFTIYYLRSKVYWITSLFTYTTCDHCNHNRGFNIYPCCNYNINFIPFAITANPCCNHIVPKLTLEELSSLKYASLWVGVACPNI